MSVPYTLRMAYGVRLTGKADKLLRKLPDDVRGRVLRKARELSDDPHGAGRKLKGDWADFWRAEVGKSYRIVYVIEGEIVRVTWLGPREKAPYD